MKEIEREILKIFKENNFNEEEKKLFLMVKASESFKSNDFETAKICEKMINEINKNTSN